ncbi:hypothetical protein L211DRAFT_844857 [Terfezia boudieri ATCC MYA-4762]|uniref:Uncharacterized protein n=1 Tax=Terfezia boudieri ATCC MYA-4762 TaxID=1051890 RepID=A0A3N4M469_9PEZI|nr:hypothetical protein L211DRAFT_844857 [Terfezia boudieri ATCC MYA-4762]
MIYLSTYRQISNPPLFLFAWTGNILPDVILQISLHTSEFASDSGSDSDKQSSNGDSERTATPPLTRIRSDPEPPWGDPEYEREIIDSPNWPAESLEYRLASIEKSTGMMLNRIEGLTDHIKGLEDLVRHQAESIYNLSELLTISSPQKAQNFLYALARQYQQPSSTGLISTPQKDDTNKGKEGATTIRQDRDTPMIGNSMACNRPDTGVHSSIHAHPILLRDTPMTGNSMACNRPDTGVYASMHAHPNPPTSPKRTPAVPNKEKERPSGKAAPPTQAHPSGSGTNTSPGFSSPQTYATVAAVAAGPPITAAPSVRPPATGSNTIPIKSPPVNSSKRTEDTTTTHHIITGCPAPPRGANWKRGFIATWNSRCRRLMPGVNMNLVAVIIA